MIRNKRNKAKKKTTNINQRELEDNLNLYIMYFVFSEFRLSIRSYMFCKTSNWKVEAGILGEKVQK